MDEQLTEFEKEFKKYCCGVSDEWIQFHAKKLLSVARKQIANEINADAMVKQFNKQFEGQHIWEYALETKAYRTGINDTLKALKDKQ